MAGRHPTHVARLEYPRETGLILRCAGKAGNPFQTTQGNRLSMSIESVMPSSHLILCRPLFLLPPIPPSIRVFSNESTLHDVAKVLESQPQHQSFQRTPRADLCSIFNSSEKAMATHSSTLAWKIPWAEERNCP